ncbi:uncharacterized protein PHACADRAFT_212928 [Phanerochaete carnosa HHB-10118-sp]|uniref:Uncharacterized protein n=1 Tax=Phanerochaete carnosa (strain HHB-10118-sp) TaxID=650164 RepID=K5UMU4_PHACS|nr:uncharacterized protein PHACADRAFT_212928 [Phanerochaete carnosa HHB-10118-sp]EKM51026.1 hypothetical protein PHACADRAFT_212928 [Phanerochaete carnosa HHB-10118-sp]
MEIRRGGSMNIENPLLPALTAELSSYSSLSSLIMLYILRLLQKLFQMFFTPDTGLDEDEESRLSDAQGVISRLRAEKERAIEAVRDGRKRIAELEEAIRGRNMKAEEELSAAWLREKEENEMAERYRKEREDATAEAASLKSHIEEFRRREEEHRRDAGALQQQIEQQSELLQIRGAELRDAIAYLAKDDSVSCTGIIGMLDYLNSEIFQVCAQIEDIWKIAQGDSVDLSGAVDDLQNCLGPTAVDVLGAIRAHHCDEHGAQMVLQASLLQAAGEIIMAWAPSMNATENQFVRQLYERIYVSEPQAVSAKWRALTKRYVKDCHTTLDLSQSITSRIIHIVEDILELAGLTVVPQHVPESSGFVEKLHAIVCHCIKLRETIGEQVLSRDYRLIRPTCDEAFDVETMEDSDPPNDTQQEQPGGRDRVLFLTGLGLESYEKKREGDLEVGAIERTVHLKSKVVTHATLQDLTTVVEGRTTPR